MHEHARQRPDVPQRQTASRRLQRELRVHRGDEEDRQKLIDLLGPPAGLRLRHEFGTIQIETEAPSPRSAALADLLKQVVNNRKRHAEIDLFKGTTGTGRFGQKQGLWIDAIASLEAQAPGAGVALASHEIWENYQSWVQPDTPHSGVLGADDVDELEELAEPAKQGKYGPAHSSAVERENAILSEIRVPSRRVAAAAGMRHEGWIVDYMTHYLVAAPRGRDFSTGINAQWLGREHVATVQLNFAEFSADADGPRKLAKEAADAYLRNKLTTARVTGWRAADESATLSKQRANEVCKYLIGDDVLDQDEDPHRGVGANVGSRQVWSDDGGVRETPGVTITIEQPQRG